MKKITSLIALTAMFVGATTLAETEKQMKIHVATDGVGHEATEIRLSGADMDFDLQDMQVGETRSVVDESGRSVLITRQEDGFEFNIDGKVINMPDMHGEFATLVNHEIEDGEVHKMRAHKMVMADGDNDIMIVSGTPLDSSTQDSIRAVLQSAGHDADVKFIDGGAGGGEHQVKVIRKQVITE